MRCVSYMRKDSFWRDERSAFHERFRKKNKATPYYDFDGNLIASRGSISKPMPKSSAGM